jgi:hypothetical protein
MTLCHGSGVYWPVSYGGGYGLTIRKFGWQNCSSDYFFLLTFPFISEVLLHQLSTLINVSSIGWVKELL